MTSSSYTEALIAYNAQGFRPDYKMTWSDMLTMANTLDVMRQSANLHNSGEWPLAIYEHLEKSELEILAQLYGRGNARKLLQAVVESGESIAYVMAVMAGVDEDRAYADARMGELHPEGCYLCRKHGHSFYESCLD